MTTVTLPRATVEQALGALEHENTMVNRGDGHWEFTHDLAAAALRAALAQQAEPVAFDWPRKACPCRDVQNGECLKLGCKWERDPSLVPQSLRRASRPIDEGELWSWVRSVMSQGADIRFDYEQGVHKGYEAYSARLDAAAAERAEELAARLKTPNAEVTGTNGLPLGSGAPTC